MPIFNPTYGGYATFEIVDPDTIKNIGFAVFYDKGIVFKRKKQD